MATGIIPSQLLKIKRVALYLGGELLQHTLAAVGHLVEDVRVFLLFAHILDATESTSVICIGGADFQHDIAEWILGIELSEVDLLHVGSGGVLSCRCGVEAGGDEEEDNREKGGADHL